MISGRPSSHGCSFKTTSQKARTSSLTNWSPNSWRFSRVTSMPLCCASFLRYPPKLTLGADKRAATLMETVVLPPSMGAAKLSNAEGRELGVALTIRCAPRILEVIESQEQRRLPCAPHDDPS